jgi:hypothetical protein
LFILLKPLNILGRLEYRAHCTKEKEFEVHGGGIKEKQFNIFIDTIHI